MSIKHYDWSDINNPPEIEEHSLVKHEVLTFYLERYIKILTANPRQPILRLWLIDGFAGGGRYRTVKSNQIHVHDGSPLILLKTINRMRSEIQAERTKQFDIDAKYFFVEKDRAAFVSLQEILRSEGYLPDKNVTMVNKTFIDTFPDIFGKIKNEGGRSPRCIFLLDQYGYSDVPFGILNTIFVTFPETAEVLLTFATEHLIQYMSENEKFKIAMKNAGLESVITDELIKSFRDTPSYEKPNARLIIEQILATSIFEKSNAQFFAPFFIKSKTSGWSFLLVHLSCHLRARDEMNKVHWELKNCSHHYGTAGLKNFKANSELASIIGYDALYNENQASFEYNFDEPAEKRTYDALREELPEKIFNSREKKVTVGSLLLENCNYTPANSAHFKKTLVELIKYKVIKILSPDGKHERSSANTIQNGDIVEFKQRTFSIIDRYRT